MNTKNIKSILSIIMMVMILSAFSMESVNAVNICERFDTYIQKAYISDDIAVIDDYYKAIVGGYWQSEYEIISNNYISEMEVGASYSTTDLYTGVANIKNIDAVTVISEIGVCDYAYYCDYISEPHCYLVRANIETFTDDGFNWTGINYHVVICGTENGLRKVFDVRQPLPHTVTDNETDAVKLNDYLSLRFNNQDYYINDYNHGDTPKTLIYGMPKEIRVKRFYRDETPDAAIETVDFKLYTKYVLNAEIIVTESPNYSNQEFECAKANALICRNFGLYRYLSSGVNAAFHIYDCSGSTSHGHPKIEPSPADQMYTPEITTLFPISDKAVEETWNTIFANDDFKIFLPRYANGKYNDDAKSGGQFKHQGSKYLALELNYDCNQIIHYYYDYSTSEHYPVGSGGIIHIIPLGDVNYDEVVNTGDATLTLKHISDLTKLSEMGVYLADFNKDGTVNTGDVTKMLIFIVQ